MEKDDEVKGEGNSYTTMFRQYDPRLGKWLSLDPLAAKYPDQSPYVGYNNNPIYFVDPLGLEGLSTNETGQVTNIVYADVAAHQGTLPAADPGAATVASSPADGGVYSIITHRRTEEDGSQTVLYHEAIHNETAQTHYIIGADRLDEFVDRESSYAYKASVDYGLSSFYYENELAPWVIHRELGDHDAARAAAYKDAWSGGNIFAAITMGAHLIPRVRPSTIGATGRYGARKLANRVGGTPEVPLKTSRGIRRVDQLSNGVAHEAKTGYTSYSSFVKKQVAKDIELMTKGRVDAVEWHFYKSPTTGLVGPSKSLRKALEDAGIKIHIHK